MKVLVTWASRHGSTAAIAQAIGTTLREAGHDVTVAPAEEAMPEGCDAVVAGSAVYVGHWMKPAREFVAANAAALRERPIWLFSSGPIGDPPKPMDDPADVEELASLCGARGHRLFAGRLDKRRLGIGERTIVRLVHGAYGDFRNWDEIRDWAEGIAAALATKRTALRR